MRSRDQKGSALVVALFVFTLAVVIVSGLLERQSISLKRMANIFDLSQASLYALGLETWAGEVLRRDSEEDAKTGQKIDYLGEAWAARLAPFKLDHGEVVGVITDLQGRFNLNNLKMALTDPNHVQLAVFKRLLKNLDIDPELTDAVMDWIDPDNDPRLTGAEENDYLSLKPPYRTGNVPFASVSELRLIKGMTEENFLKLAPHVCVLPSKTEAKINVNTATIPVLMALLVHPARADAEQMVAGRGKSGYKNESAFKDGFKNKLREPGAPISTDSSFFLLAAKATIGRGTATLESVIQREGGRYHILSRAWERHAWNE